MAPVTQTLVCPVCQGALVSVACAQCGRSYAREAEVWDLTPVPPPDRRVRRRWGLWEALQANGAHAYEVDPPSSLSVGERDDARAFAAFSQLEGRVLDVGCGPQALPSYASGFGGELHGIDPLLGEQPRDFEFVKGLAEFLPYPDDSFDRVLFATSVDHFLSPARAVDEAARVTKPGGLVSVWMGEVAPQPTRRERAADFLLVLRQGNLRLVGQRLAGLTRRKPRTAEIEVGSGVMELAIPRGAIDAFHFAHPAEAEVRGWLANSGLRVDAVDRSVPGSFFIRAVLPQPAGGRVG